MAGVSRTTIKKHIQIMRFPLIRSSYLEIYKKIEDATAWLTDQGLRIEPTRIGEYKRFLSKILSLHQSGKFNNEEIRKYFGKYLNIVYEVQELVYIFTGLSPIIKDELSSRFRQFIKGPISYIDENINTSSNVARNVGFELLIAAILANAGLKIEFGTLADLKIIFNNYTFFVECKRPQYEHQINSNIKGALRQLEDRYKFNQGKDNLRGIIAISVSKILNPELKILVKHNVHSLHSYTENILDDFHKKYKSKWLNPRDKRTIGAIIYFSTPTSIEEENIIAHTYQVDFTNCCNSISDDMNLMRELAIQVQEMRNIT
ncbi:MAG: hypothetical protein V3U54_02925 [Thermodesulfobacteriota bacterium]